MKIQIIKRLRHQQVVLSALMMTLSFDLLAALPTPVAPSLGKPKGDWLTLIKGYIKDGGLVLGLSTRSPLFDDSKKSLTSLLPVGAWLLTNACCMGIVNGQLN